MNNNRRQFIKKSLIFGAFSIFAPKILTNCFPVRGNEPFGIELIRGVANGNIESQKAFAAYIGPVIKNLLYQAYPLSYSLYSCGRGENEEGLSIPLDIGSGNGYGYRKGVKIL